MADISTLDVGAEDLISRGVEVARGKLLTEDGVDAKYMEPYGIAVESVYSNR